jgi:hypothetical protein
MATLSAVALETGKARPYDRHAQAAVKRRRAPEKINRLILEGEKQGEKFVEARLKLAAQGGKGG